jgi:hypothetical protein
VGALLAEPSAVKDSVAGPIGPVVSVAPALEMGEMREMRAWLTLMTLARRASTMATNSYPTRKTRKSLVKGELVPGSRMAHPHLVFRVCFLVPVKACSS